MLVSPSVLLNVSGLFTLSAPFDTMLTENVIYKCISVRTLQDYFVSGDDPKKEFYTANSISDKFEEDLSNSICIVTLQSQAGLVVRVPSSYINTYPDLNGVLYTGLMLGVDLGALPNSFDLSHLIYKIENIVKEIIGISGEVHVVATNETTVVGFDDSAQLELARKNMITETETDYTKFVKATNELNSLRQKNSNLENYIKIKSL